MPEGPIAASRTSESASSLEGAAKKKHITEYFNGAIEPIKPSPLYQLGLLVVAVVIVLLPVAYLGLIALVCYLVYLHAVGDTAILTSTRSVGRGYIVLLAIYLAPIIA